MITPGDLGLYVVGGMMLRNDAAQLATEPDAMFISHESLARGAVRFTAGKKRGAVATVLEGTPDLAVEVVSPSSEDDDAEWMMSAYHNAGIPEYWPLDAHTERIRFDIFAWKEKGFAAGRKSAGWVKYPSLGVRSG